MSNFSSICLSCYYQNRVFVVSYYTLSKFWDMASTKAEFFFGMDSQWLMAVCGFVEHRYGQLVALDGMLLFTLNSY